MSDTLTNGLRTATDRARGFAGVFQGFKDFISRGSAIELAVGVVIGAAFTAVVGALQNGFISPLIGMIFGKPEISWKIGPINQSTIDMGLIVNAFIQFLLTAAAVYFVIVLPLNRLAERRKRGVEAESTRPSEDILLLQEIRDLLAERSSPALRADTGRPPQPGTPEVPGAGTPPTGRPPIA